MIDHISAAIKKLEGISKDSDVLRSQRPALGIDAADHSCLSTRSPSFDMSPDEATHFARKQLEARQRRAASLPVNQFAAELDEEKDRVWRQHQDYNRDKPRPIGGIIDEQALEHIRSRWQNEEKIWPPDKDLPPKSGELWPHKMPHRVQKATAKTNSLFQRGDPYRQQGDSKAGLQGILASIPYDRFHFEMARVRKKLTAERIRPQELRLDTGTWVYRKARENWERRAIWDPKWQVFPGFEWMHERPEDEVVDKMLSVGSPTFAQMHGQLEDDRKVASPSANSHHVHRAPVHSSQRSQRSNKGNRMGDREARKECTSSTIQRIARSKETISTTAVPLAARSHGKPNTTHTLDGTLRRSKRLKRASSDDTEDQFNVDKPVQKRARR